MKTTMTRFAMTLSAVLLLSGCSSSGTPKGNGTGAGPSSGGACTFTISGAQTGSFPCGASGVDEGSGVFTVDITSSSNDPTAKQTVVHVDMTLNSAPAVGTYTFDNIVEGQVSVVLPDLTQFVGKKSKGSGATTGALTVVISAVSTRMEFGGATGYVLSGSLDGTTVTGSGAGGTAGETIAVHATF